MWDWLKSNLERLFLFAISLIFLTFSIAAFLNADIAGATAAFAMFFLCLIYGNVSRFKRFRGLGIEAELWEDTQKEAANLIDRLKNIVQVYTQEIVMMKVMSGRWGGTSDWSERWALYDELVGQHDSLGHRIDFLPLKEKVYRVMVFDAVSSAFSKIDKVLIKAYADANKKISQEFGHPISDAAKHAEREKELEKLRLPRGNLFEISQTENVARLILKNTEESVKGLKDRFGIEVALPDEAMERLKKIDTLVQANDFRVDPDLVRWADGGK